MYIYMTLCVYVVQSFNVVFLNQSSVRSIQGILDFSRSCSEKKVFFYFCFGFAVVITATEIKQNVI